jgi:TRAP-type C4-dicarboxylate transport system substrate-binding protein
MRVKHSLAQRVPRALLFAALVLALAVAATVGATDPPEPWKLSTAVGPTFALGKAGARWAQLIVDKSDGKVSVRVVPGAALASRDPAREFIALRDGAADLAVGSTLFWAWQVVELNVVALPWIAPEEKDLAALAGEAVAPRLAAAIERAGAVPLAIAVLGHRALATTGRELRSPEDMAGMKVRLPSTPLLTDLFVGLGAEPRSMAFADAQAALLAGTLDAQEGTLATIAAARLDTLGVKHVLHWGAIAECAVFAANKAAWNGWTAEQRAVARDAALEVARGLSTLARAENDSALVELRKRGVTVARLTATGRNAFAAAARGVYDKWTSLIGPDLVRAAESAVGDSSR